MGISEKISAIVAWAKHALACNRKTGAAPDPLSRQISLHYIYNCLQCIAALCDSDAAKAKQAILAFADYLRGNLESITEDGLIPFERELAHTSAYINLEKLTGSRQFDVEYRLDVMDFMLPPLTLQAVVENAVRYGTGTGPQSSKVVIETTEKFGTIEIKVVDEGHGLGVEGSQHTKGKSIGLENVRARLEAECKGALDIDNSSQGTTVTIRLPKSLD